MKELKMIADNGDGTYTNPILSEDYSDPDAIRVGEDYYMVASSFTNTPGLPLLHSKDLVNWQVINYCIKNVPGGSYSEKVRHGCGIWAPAIRFHEGVYYVCFPMPDEGIFMTTALDPYGEWTEPVNIRPGAGWIDPCPFWDEDGKAYLVSGVAKSRIGYNNVLFMTEMAPDGMSLTGEPVKIFNGEDFGLKTTEGPKLYKKNGFYYVLAPAGGVKPGVQIALRSKNIYGPYECKVICKQGGTDINGPHQGAWVDTVSGEDWFIHFRDVFALGRITYLEPMSWKEDWPVVGTPVDGEYYGEPVHTYKKPDVGNTHEPTCPETGDEFEMGKLNTAWQFNGNHEEAWLKPLRNGRGIGLMAVPDRGISEYMDLPNVVLQKWPAPEFKAKFTLDISKLTDGDRAGIVTVGMTYGGIIIENLDGRLSLKTVTGTQTFKDGIGNSKSQEKLVSEDIRPMTGTGKLRIMYKVTRTGQREADEGVLAPVEEVSFYLSFDGVKYRKLVSHEGAAGRWVGAKVGTFAASKKEKSDGYLIMESVRFEN